MTSLTAIERGIFLVLCLSLVSICDAQDLAPRAYIITPVHWNAVTLTYSFSDGGILFDNVVPITNATATLQVPVFSYFHSLNFFGRSANILVSLPYGVGHLQGTFIDNEPNLYLSGLLYSICRFSVSLTCGPAISSQKHKSVPSQTH